MNRLALWLVLGLAVTCVGLRVTAQEPAEETPAAESAKADESAAAEPHAKAEDDHGKPDDHAKTGDSVEHAADGDHGAHDPHDLSHGNASEQLKAAQELRFDLAIATFLVFVLLLIILAKFAWGPISRGLEQREETIARQIEEARLGAERAVRSLQEYEAKLGAATEEARHIVAQARKDAEAAKDRIVAEARDAAGKERDRAVADITAAKNQALQEIAQKSVSTAVTLAGKIIRREVKPQDHEALIGDALNQFTKLN
jgi:F-type H+-transporting ATPase subunit b